MKYVRTKDNIFEVENEKPNSIIFCKPRHTKMLVEIDENVYEMKNIIIMREIGKDHWKEEILKQADTIEELCDEFVWNLKGSNKRKLANSIFPFSRIKLELDKQFDGDYELYGAIWLESVNNEPILKSVAKMNEKGELELL